VYDFIGKIMCDRMGIRGAHPEFQVFRLSGSNEVYGYEEQSTRARLICKFYAPRFGWDRDRAASKAYQEYRSLKTLRGK